MDLPAVKFTVPVVNLSDLEPETEAWITARTAVKHAMEECGCFIAIFTGGGGGGGDIFEAAAPLFNLPAEIKSRNTSSKPFFGRFQPSPVSPLHESFGLDHPTTMEATQSFANLMWPAAGNDRFCQSSLSMTKRFVGLHETVMKMVSESYGVGFGFDDDSINYMVRYLKYNVPPPESQANVGLDAHADKSFISIIHQNHVNGLQVRRHSDHQGRMWATADLAMPDSFLVFAGDAMMAWSNGRIESSWHRVIMEGEEERYCMGLFSFIREGIAIQSPEAFVDEAHPRRFKPFDHFGYLQHHRQRLLSGVITVGATALIDEYCGVGN